MKLKEIKMISKIKEPKDLFKKIDDVHYRASKAFGEINPDALALARNVGAARNVNVDVAPLKRKIK